MDGASLACGYECVDTGEELVNKPINLLLLTILNLGN